jgi:Ca2+-binding EF-hand superfamily protein
MKGVLHSPSEALSPSGIPRPRPLSDLRGPTQQVPLPSATSEHRAASTTVVDALSAGRGASLAEHFGTHVMGRVQSILAALMEWDEDHNDGISFRELSAALASIGIVDQGDHMALWEQLDKDRSGDITHAELLAAVGPNKTSRGAHEGGAVLGSGQLRVALARMAHKHVVKVFRAWDEDSSGSLSRHEFAKAITALGLTVGRSQMAALFDDLDADGSNAIEYGELKRAMGRDVSMTGGVALGLNGQTGGVDQGGGGRALQKLVTKPPMSLQPITLDPGRPFAGQISDALVAQTREVISLFREWDTDNSDSLSWTEFKQAMRSLGLGSSKAIQRLWREMDKDGNGKLVYDEMLEALAPPKVAMAPLQYQKGASRDAGAMRVNVTGTIRSASKQLHEAFEDVATNRVIDVFTAWDSDGSGTLTRKEFGKAMAALGVKATRASINQLFNQIDTDNTGRINYKEFYLGIKKERGYAAGSRTFQ